jgi:hypothetical protein
MSTLEKQLSGIGRALVQVNLRLAKLAEGVQSAPATPSDPAPGHLDLLLDLLEAVEKSLQAPVPPEPPSRWWRPWAVAIAGPDLSGLALTREHVLERLGLAGLRPVPSQGKLDPRLHRVIATKVPDSPDLDGTLCETHHTGWVSGDKFAHVIRLAQVTAWRTLDS